MRRLLGAAAAAVLAAALTACSATPPKTTAEQKDFPVDTPELVQLKQQAGVEECPSGAVASGEGALPKVTLDCLGGGTPVDLSTLQGPLILNVWSSACDPCRKEMPILGEFHRKHGDQIPLLGVDLLDNYPGVALEQAAERKATYPQLFDFYGEIQETKKLFAPGLPTFFFLHEDGSITRESGGLTSMDQLLTMVDTQFGTKLS